MTAKISGRFQQKKFQILRLLILILAGVAALGALLLPLASRPQNYQIQLGSVSTQDYQAPRRISYISNALTQQRIKAAESAVANVYLPVDPAIARIQIDKLRKSLDYINLIRNDLISDESQKIEDLSKLNDIHLSKESATKLLNIEESDWQLIQRESISVLEQIMRASIRDTQVSEAQARIPSLISYTFNDENSQIVQTITSPFVVPNSLFSPESTDNAKKEAVAAIQPVEKSFAVGEIIVRRGQIIDPVTYEALTKLNLITPNNQNREIVAASLFSLTFTFVVAFYFRKRSQTSNSIRQLLILVVSFLFFLFLAKYLIPNRAIIPYLFPVAGFSFAISALFGFETSLFLTLILSSFIAYSTGDFYGLIIFYMLPSMAGNLLLGQGRRISTFFAAGGITGITGAVLILALRLLEGTTDWVGLITLVLASFFNGMASASIGLLLQFLISQFLGITTAIQLLELARPDHPLLQLILKNSPGSYQHSLQVANLSEQAAKEIGADQLLTRVGAIYHDVGKAMNPSYFIENQVTGAINSHDDVDPYMSAATIIQHVFDGVELAHKYHLPERIIDFIREHHGTLMTRYFYVKAVEQNDNKEEGIDKSLFQYPGPKPQSKETALLMLADGCEARARAEKPSNLEELKAIVQKVIDFCQSEGQLEDTELTMRDLNTIKTAFANTLINTYHPRIRYPELKR